MTLDQASASWTQHARCTQTRYNSVSGDGAEEECGWQGFVRVYVGEDQDGPWTWWECGHGHENTDPLVVWSIPEDFR